MNRLIARLPAAQCTSHHPRLVGDTLDSAGALQVGRVTWWAWPGPGPGVTDPARSLKVSAEPEALWLELDGAEPQRIAYRRAFVCERVAFLCTCGRGAYHLFERDGRFMCGHCRGLGFASRAPEHRNDAAARIAVIERKLAANRAEHDRLMRDKIEATAVIARRIARKRRRIEREAANATAQASAD